ncbi:hypothetical protein BDZ45DRAFT_680021 [Acephala macrosclerotiorum]|nr:hypothetical protein BDZ45DRAFT_680021 [Acephala macrosclerotiorum]
MLSATWSLLCVAFLALGAAAVLEGYNIVDIQWEVLTTAGGPTVLVNGTIQEVYQQLSAINPDFETEFPPTDKKSLARRAVAAEKRDNEKRYTVESYFCGGRWAYCDFDSIISGVNYLDGVSGSPTNGPGPGNCGRVSCSYDAAIYWCNDHTTSYTLNSFADIATGADNIAVNCYIDIGDGVLWTSGQQFYTDSWNVIVRQDSC